jgi:FMN phosphatase YigB (HAD superfamily)
MTYYSFNHSSLESHREILRQRDIFLIDLDGTLLENSMPLFLWANVYFMVKRFGPVFGWSEVVAKTKACLDLILENPHPQDQSNYEILFKAFSGWAKVSPEQAHQALWKFYLDDFPKLRKLTKPVPMAKEGLQQLRQQGKSLYLATNPIWPKACVLKRLEWSGIPHDWFLNITHSENWSVCKPNPLYYQKLLVDWNLPANNCVMIGNDFRKDGPSVQVGIPCVLLPEKNKGAFWQQLANVCSQTY